MTWITNSKLEKYLKGLENMHARTQGQTTIHYRVSPIVSYQHGCDASHCRAAQYKSRFHKRQFTLIGDLLNGCYVKVLEHTIWLQS